MKKDKGDSNTISSGTLHEILLDIKYRLDHIEDITADERAVIVKLVKQSNEIVKFLKQLNIEEVIEDEFGFQSSPLKKEDLEIPTQTTQLDSKKMSEVRELLEEFMERQKSLQLLEKELEKYKDQITPGQIGEA